MGLRYSKQRHKPRISKSQIPWLLRGAIRSNNVETLQYLFSYPNKVDPSMVIDGVCPLNLAVELGHLQMVKILIKAGADIFVADAPRYPLHQASLYGRGPIAELLLRSGASISALTERRQSCLHLLAHQSAERFVETAHVLMRHNANPNTLDDDGLAPLHRASSEMVHVLTSYEVTDLNISSRDGDTPLLTAVKDRREAVVLSLLNADQHLREQQQQQQPEEARQHQTTKPKNSVCRTGSATANETSVHYPTIRTASAKSSNSATSRLTLASAASAVFRIASGFNDFTVMRSSSAAAVNVHSVGHKAGSKVFKPPCSPSSPPVCDEMDVKVVEARLSAQQQLVSAKHFKTQPNELDVGSPPSRRPAVASSYSGSANLFCAFRKTDQCQRCHSMGNPGDISGWWQSCDRLQRLLTKATSSMHSSNIAAASRQVPPQTSVRPLLDLDKPDKLGMTALMIAAEAGNSGLVMAMALIAAGCNVAATDKVGMTALHHACYVGSLNMVRFLLERVQPTTGSNGKLTSSPQLYSAAQLSCNTSGANGRFFCADLLDIQDKYGRTPIYLAACRGHTEVVNYLLGLSADFHIPNKEHKSPLYISAYFGYLEITNTLLRHGAQVDQVDSHRKTPLYVATYHGRSEIVDLLLAAGANVNSADKNGKTPLYVAVLHGHLALAQKLLNAGASVNRVDREGLGPLHMAVKFPKLDIPMVKLLLNYGCDPVNLASFTRWLLVHGIIPQECIHGDDELASWLHWEERNVRSLKRLCRVAIQRALGTTDSVRWKIRRLPLPENLLSYVSMKEL
ncbi:ankyrin repeat protein [Opisthorchis viverrini]|uniref:Ankyrin repeat protein n=1 Tax=Opisthorchis viverrini TaxID=6198 RepID=A0A1S8WVB6_OPIVI|nr:ankyrin repeat protein [Opisthorchis viverrini]